MKKYIKKLVNFLALVLVGVFCLSFVACSEADMRTLKVEIQVCDYETNEVTEEVIEISLYRHLAKNTVDTIVKYVREGYYDNTVFYIDEDHSGQVMLGDIKYDQASNKYVLNSVKPQINAEIPSGGVSGSNLRNVEGAVGLWRSWFAGSNYTVTNGIHSGRATMYIPTGTNTTYNDNFCVFGKINLDKYSDLFESIQNALKGDNYEEYVIYFTGTYDQTQPDNYFGLTPHFVSQDEFDDMSEQDKEAIFKAESEDVNDNGIIDADEMQFVEYNQRTIRIAKNSTGGEKGAFIKKVTVK